MTRSAYDQIADIPIGEKNDRGEWTNKRELIPGRIETAIGLREHSGLTVHRLPQTGYVVAETHYTVEKNRRLPGWATASSARYGRRRVRSYKWRQEMEIDFDASAGDPVYGNWEPEVHVVDPFEIPANWPRWVMYDPGGVNPHAVEWWAMDPTPPLYTLFCYRQWYKGLEMPDRSEGTYYLATDVVRIMHELSIDHLGNMERIDAIIIDPAAKQTKATATATTNQSGFNPTERTMTMYEEIIEVCDQVGWRIDVVTGNNLKDAAIDDVIDRLGNYPLYEVDPLSGDVYLEPETGEPIPLTDEEGIEMWVEPRLFVFTNCRWAAWEFSHYTWANWTSDMLADKRNRPETPVDKNDHSMTNLIRLMNWIRRDPALYGGRSLPEPTDHAARLVANWRKRRKEAVRAFGD